MSLALLAARAPQPARNDEQRRAHVEVMLPSEFTRLWRHAVAARTAAQPEAIAQTFYVSEMNLTPGVILGLHVPHAAFPTLRGRFLRHTQYCTAKRVPRDSKPAQVYEHICPEPDHRQNVPEMLFN